MASVSRRAVLAAAGAGAGVAVVGLAVARSTGGDPLRVRAADLSTLLQVEAAGVRFTDRGVRGAADAIIAGHGATHVRLRLWVSPGAGAGDLTSALRLAARASPLGLKPYVALHYSDTWADPKNQTTPSAWAGQSLDALRATVRAYTADVVTAFATQGTPIDIVQIGNEITYGMLWPVGQVYSGGREDWAAFTSLLRAATEGAQDGGGVREVVVHVHNGTDVDSCLHFFHEVRDAGVRFDTMGLSHYPFWNGTLAGLATSMARLAETFDGDVLVAETAYPWELARPGVGAQVVTSADELPERASFAPTPAGQAAYYEGLRTTLHAVPGGRGSGFAVWEPAWAPAASSTTAAGEPYPNLSLFDAEGAALPAISSFRAPGA